MGRNSDSIQYLFAVKVNWTKITLEDYPETDRATRKEKTPMWSFSWLRNALHTTFCRSYYISLHHMAVRQSATYGNPVRQRETLKKEQDVCGGIVNTWM